MMWEAVVIIIASLYIFAASRKSTDKAACVECRHGQRHHSKSGRRHTPQHGFRTEAGNEFDSPYRGLDDEKGRLDDRQWLSAYQETPGRRVRPRAASYGTTGSDAGTSSSAETDRPNAFQRQLPPHVQRPTRYSTKANAAACGRSAPNPPSPVALFCRPCNRFFLHEAAIRQHIATAHNDSPVCRDCHRAFSNTEALRQHKAVFHGSTKVDGRSQTLTCHPRGRAFMTRMALVQHTATEAHKSTAESLIGKESAKSLLPDERVARQSPNRSPYPAVSSDAHPRGTMCELCLGTVDSAETLEEHKLQSHSWIMHCKTCRLYFDDDPQAKQHYRVIHRMIGVHPSKMQILAESLIRTLPSDSGSQEDEGVEKSFDDDDAPCDRPEFADATDYATPTPGTHACPACQKTFGNPYDLVRHRSSPTCGPAAHQNTSERPSAIADGPDTPTYSGGIDLGQDLPTFAFAPPTYVRNNVAGTRALGDVAYDEEASGSQPMEAAASSSEDDWEPHTPEDDQDDVDLARLEDRSVWPSLGQDTIQATRKDASIVESIASVRGTLATHSESTDNATRSEPSGVEVTPTQYAQGRRDRSTLLQGGWPSMLQEDAHGTIAQSILKVPSPLNSLGSPQQDTPHRHALASSIGSGSTPSVHAPHTFTYPGSEPRTSSGIFHFPEANPHHAIFPEAPTSPIRAPPYGVIERPTPLRGDASAFRPSGAWGMPLADRLKQLGTDTMPSINVTLVTPHESSHSNMDTTAQSRPTIRSPGTSFGSDSRSTSASKKRPAARRTWADRFAQEEKEEEESEWMPAIDRGWITHQDKPVVKSRGGKTMDAEATRRAEEERQRRVFEEERLQTIADGGEDPYGGW